MEKNTKLLEQKIKELEKQLELQKNVKLELENSDERFKILFEKSPDGYFLCDLKWVFLDGNAEAERITGYEKKELIGKNMLKANLLPLEYLPKAASHLVAQALGKDVKPWELQLIKKDGSQIWVEISSTLVKIANKKIILGTARDISNRKKVEEELKKKNEELERFNEAAVGRELKLIELKKKILKLEEELKNK